MDTPMLLDNPLDELDEQITRPTKKQKLMETPMLLDKPPLDELDEQITRYREALHHNATGELGPFFSLSLALWDRFERDERREDLDECISVEHDMLQRLPEGHPERPSVLYNLAASLRSQFKRSGNLDDIEQSILLFRSSIELRPPGHLERSSSLVYLGVALYDRFHQSGDREDLNQSISMYRSGIELQPLEHPEHSSSLLILGNALHHRFQKSGNGEDLEQSISLFRSSLELRPPGHPGRSLALESLGKALFYRFEHSGDREDLEQSISLFRSSLELRPPGHPGRSSALISLGDTLSTRFEHSGDREDLEEGMRSLKYGAHHEYSSSLDRLLSAHLWVEIGRENNHCTCLEAYETAVSFEEASLTAAPTLEIHHRLLNVSRGFPSLAVDAASYAIQQGALTRAVEFLEQARILLRPQMRGPHATLGDLAEADNVLATSFLDVSQKLEALATADLRDDDSRRRDEIMRQNRLLSEKRKEIISAIRLVPDFEDFQRPTPFSRLQEAAAEGPVVILNHSRYRSDAIIVLPDRDPLIVPLSDNQPDFYGDTFELHKKLLVAGSRSLTIRPRNYGKILTYVLEKLWRLVVSKVVAKLKEIGIPNGSRIWWCPSSVLRTLPFHAAGEWRLDGHGVRKYHTHEYISSYTPSLNALIQARRPLNSPPDHVPSLLFVGQEDETLQWVGQEGDEIDLGERDERLIGEDATPKRVLESMKRHDWIHFACHGTLESGKPCFRLSDGARLTLLDIVGARVPNTELAFLAACHTAKQTKESAGDEVLILAAGMQFCGFRSVIGTMWAMLDEDAPAFARLFYKHMLADDGTPERGFKRSARALHAAATELRLRKEVSLESWVNFVHIGA